MYLLSDIMVFELYCILEFFIFYGKVFYISLNFFIFLRYGILICILFDNDRKKLILGGENF